MLFGGFPFGSPIKNMPANSGDTGDLGLTPWGWEDVLKEGMAKQTTILAWRIPWTEEPDGLQSMGSQRVRHDGASEHAHVV